MQTPAITYEDIISVENLLLAWREFLCGKRKKPDVQEFGLHLMDNLFALRKDLLEGRYRHGGYSAFKISDPKPRDIHKASVRDRLVHHALYRKLYPLFDRLFIADSYSCRKGKGTHSAINRFRTFVRRIQSTAPECWVLQCDIRKFFASIDHDILMCICTKHIRDVRILGLLVRVVSSFSWTEPGKGLPLGNLTSQLLVNIYMNEFDQFAKLTLGSKHNIRYADDFVILSQNREWLFSLLPRIHDFLFHRLRLSLHPRKVLIRKVARGVDFLGWIHFPDHRVLRAATRRRMLRRCKEIENKDATITSYRGLLSHGNARKLEALLTKVSKMYKRISICENA